MAIRSASGATINCNWSGTSTGIGRPTFIWVGFCSVVVVVVVICWVVAAEVVVVVRISVAGVKLTSAVVVVGPSVEDVDPGEVMSLALLAPVTDDSTVVAISVTSLPMSSTEVVRNSSSGSSSSVSLLRRP